MKNLKKITRNDLKKVIAGNAPAEVKCGPLLCPDGQQCCYHVGGQFYFCHSNSSRCDN